MTERWNEAMTSDSELPMFVIPKPSRLCNGRPDPEARSITVVRPRFPRQTKGAATDRPNLTSRDACSLLYPALRQATGTLRLDRISYEIQNSQIQEVLSWRTHRCYMSV